MKIALYLLTGATLASMSLTAATYYNGGVQQMQNYPSDGQYMYRDNYGNMYRSGRNLSDQEMYNQNPGYNGQYQSNNGQNQGYYNGQTQGYYDDQKQGYSNGQKQGSMNQNQNSSSGMMNGVQKAVSDQELLNRIRYILESKKGNFYTGINVAVNNGTVTLSGIVQTEQERSDLKSLIQKINGVNKIDDQLYIRSTLDKNQDQMYAQRAADALQNGSSADGFRNVQVSARDGIITLTGTVEQDYQKRDAQNKVQKIPGVRGVDNQIKVVSKETK